MAEYTYELPNPTQTANRRIVFDVDGVLADHRGQPRYCDRDPYPGVVDYLKTIKAAGYYIVLQTARYMEKCDGEQEEAHECGFNELFNWCHEHGIPFDEIYLGKASATLYVDDKGFRLRSDEGEKDWNRLFEELNIPTRSE